MRDIRGRILNHTEVSPVHKVQTEFLLSSNVKLDIKRDDLIHPSISGNKWRKLKYNLLAASNDNCDGIITYGGAFSNHIYATAAACREFGFQSVGIIRGEYDPRNPTLQFAKSCGMDLKFVDRSSYREKENSISIKEILNQYPDFLVIPEGGSNELSENGLKELSFEINELNHDVILVSAGTGATASGILNHLSEDKKLWVFSSLKSCYLKEEILDRVPAKKAKQLTFFSDYHWGGYGKSPANLIQFMNSFTRESKVPIDPIYNGKLIYGFSDMIRNEMIAINKSYLWIHTGGLQGISAYNYMAHKKGRLIIA